MLVLSESSSDDLVDELLDEVVLDRISGAL